LQLTIAAAFFIMAYDSIISIGIKSSPMLKCSRQRCVCAPHSLSEGILTSPKLSVSVRNLISIETFILLGMVRDSVVWLFRRLFWLIQSPIREGWVQIICRVLLP